MREILICENCSKIWTGDRKSDIYCSVCFGVLRPLNVSDGLWSDMTDNEKSELINNNENRINNKIQLEVIDGLFSGKEAYFDCELKNFVITKENVFNTSNSSIEQAMVHKNIDDISRYTIDEIEKDRSKNISLYVGALTWFASGSFNFYQTLDLFSYFDSMITGLFWGVITWIVAKQFKKKIEVIRIQFSDQDVIFKYDPNIIALLDLKFKDKNNSNVNNLVTKENIYDQLIKLKDLLDKGIITIDEFNVEKKKILNS